MKSLAKHKKLLATAMTLATTFALANGVVGQSRAVVARAPARLAIDPFAPALPIATVPTITTTPQPVLIPIAPVATTITPITATPEPTLTVVDVTDSSIRPPTRNPTRAPARTPFRP